MALAGGRHAAVNMVAAALAELPSLQRLYAAMPLVQERTSPAAHSYAPAEAQRPEVNKRRKLDVDNIPMLKLEQTCGSPKAASPQALHWQEALDYAAAALPHGDMLTDTFRRFHSYLRISLTERCNLRCQYCMPADGVELTPSQNLLTTAEIVRLAGLFVAAGVDKIRLTGGEPTVRRDLVPISAQLAALPGLRTLAMTTNGIALTRQLPALRAAGLAALNISLDTLREERYVELTRRQGAARVRAAIEAAAAQGFSVKVNVVVMRGKNDDEILDFVELVRGRPVNVRFIEYMPFDDNEWATNKMFTYREMMERIEAAHGPLQRCADPRGEVAKNYTLPGFAGSVSFITSMTEHFCSDCNRLRLMADGNLKVCLFGASEVSLRDAMREGASDAQLRRIISAAVKRKRYAHADMDVLAATKNRAMIKIGG